MQQRHQVLDLGTRLDLRQQYRAHAKISYRVQIVTAPARAQAVDAHHHLTVAEPGSHSGKDMLPGRGFGIGRDRVFKIEDENVRR